MHNTWLDQLPYYVAGTLDPADRAALETHLTECEACREALDTWMVIAGAVRDEAGGRVDALPPLHHPVASSRNGHAAAPSHDGITQPPKKTEDSPMTVHFPEIASLRPMPHSRSLLTLVAAVLLVVLFGTGAILLAQRIGDSDITDPGAPQGDQPAAPGAQAETPTALPTLPATATQTLVPTLPSSPPAEHMNAPQMTSTALIEQYQKTQAALPEELQVLPPHMTSTAFIEQYRETQTALPEELRDLSLTPTVVPPTATPVMPNIGLMTPGMSSSISAVPLDAGLPPRAEIEGVRFEAQTWNNSSPAALSMALSALGWEGDQAEAAEWLRADADDRSVMLWEMVLFVEHQTNYGALSRVGGVPALLKRLVAYGFPVVIPVGLELDDGEWYGHHWVVAGYDDEAQAFLVYDSYLGAGEDGPREVPYSELEDAWRQFNRSFMIVYRPEDRAEALDELVHYADHEYLRVLGPSMANGYRMQHPDDPWAAFNVGAAWADLGDYGTAAAAFDEAFGLGLPWRTLWYRPEPYAAYYGAGNFEAVMRLADEQSQVGFFEEAAYWRGMVYAAQGFPDLARREFQSVLDFNPNYLPAQVALGELALSELGVPVFSAGNRSTVFDAALYWSIQSQGVAPTPYVTHMEQTVPMTPDWRGEQDVPPVRVTRVPGVGEGPFIEVTRVPLEPTVPALPSQPLEATPTPVPAN